MEDNIDKNSEFGSRIQLLDCTLRDGGLGLEDAVKNGISSLKFQLEDMEKIFSLLAETGIEIIEMGSIEISEQDKKPFAIYQDIQSISEICSKGRISKSRALFAGLYRGPDTDVGEIPKWTPEYCECVRVIIRYSELQKSLDFCKSLSEKGYKVFVQPMLTMRYSEQEIDQLIAASNEMGAYALYFVDSYGYMDSNDVKRLFCKYDKDLNPDIRIGFHAHNNMNLAFSNALTFLEIDTQRKIILDSCVTGMGQGAGNLQTELITDYLNKHFNKMYNFNAILDICEILDKYLSDSLWGYSITRLLPALHKAAYKYAITFRKKYGLSYKDINRLFLEMPYDYRQRYTPENAETIIKLYY